MKRYRVTGEIIFYTSQKTEKEAEKRLRNLEFGINKKLLTSSTEVVKIDIGTVEKLPF